MIIHQNEETTGQSRMDWKHVLSFRSNERFGRGFHRWKGNCITSRIFYLSMKFKWKQRKGLISSPHSASASLIPSPMQNANPARAARIHQVHQMVRWVNHRKPIPPSLSSSIVIAHKLLIVSIHNFSFIVIDSNHGTKEELTRISRPRPCRPISRGVSFRHWIFRLWDDPQLINSDRRRNRIRTSTR